MDEYDIKAGLKEIDYAQSVSAVFTDFGAVSNEQQHKNLIPDMKARNYMPDDFRSQQGKERRAAYLKSKGLMDRHLFMEKEVVPIESPEPAK